MGFGLIAASLVLVSWLYGYWSNGLYGTKFEIDSCWQGLSACGVGLIGLFKWIVDSSKNSPVGEFPVAPKIVKAPIVEQPVVERPVVERPVIEVPSNSKAADDVISMAKQASRPKMKMHEPVKK
jgi:hypothetical protein